MDTNGSIHRATLITDSLHSRLQKGATPRAAMQTSPEKLDSSAFEVPETSLSLSLPLHVTRAGPSATRSNAV